MSSYPYTPASSQNQTSASNAGSASGSSANANATNNAAFFAPFDDRARAVEYTCGDCDSPVSLKRGEPIRCRSCGHRVLYKQRTSRMVQFEAR